MNEEKKKENKEWLCPRCGHRNSDDNESCRGGEMGDGNCGYLKPSKPTN